MAIREHLINAHRAGGTINQVSSLQALLSSMLHQLGCDMFTCDLVYLGDLYYGVVYKNGMVLLTGHQRRPIDYVSFCHLAECSYYYDMKGVKEEELAYLYPPCEFESELMYGDWLIGELHSGDKFDLKHFEREG